MALRQVPKFGCLSESSRDLKKRTVFTLFLRPQYFNEGGWESTHICTNSFPGATWRPLQGRRYRAGSWGQPQGLPVPCSMHVGTFWIEDQGPACYSGHLAGSRDQDPINRAGAPWSVPQGLICCHLPSDCVYRNDFFVKTHDREPALAPGFCFITLFYWSRKKQHIIVLLLPIFSWIKKATSTLWK